MKKNCNKVNCFGAGVRKQRKKRLMCSVIESKKNNWIGLGNRPN